jgi:hypothetical protein
MSQPQQAELLTDLADATLAGPEWERWLAAHPVAATEVQAMQQARLFLAELRSQAVTVPDDFEQCVMARVRGDLTARALLDLSLPQVGAAFLELCSALFGLLPRSSEEQRAATRSD